MGVLDKRKHPTDSEIEKIPSFIFCKWLSGNPHTIQAANLINRYDKIPITNQYKMIETAFAGKIKYIPYPKNIKDDDSLEIQNISKRFNISLEKAREYREYISDSELLEIMAMYEIKN